MPVSMAGHTEHQCHQGTEPFFSPHQSEAPDQSPHFDPICFGIYVQVDSS